MGNTNYYKILGLDSKATQEEIRRNYHKLARLYHPDLNNGKIYHEKFIAINQAYSVLRDETSRRAYDFTLREEERENAPKVTYGGFQPSGNRGNETQERKSYHKEVRFSVQDKANFDEHFKAAKKAFADRSFVKAMKEIDQALKSYDKSEPAHELKGDIFMVYKNHEEAKKEYETAFSLSKTNNPKIAAKIEECISNLKPEKKNFFTRLKNKLFETED
ncbi:MAG: DnaJ domain-containing protein [Armatimonadetes bacterium]|nr:DnaJ domain-containing protein [Candidatus Hippobium faecium]